MSIKLIGLMLEMTTVQAIPWNECYCSETVRDIPAGRFRRLPD